MTNKIIDLVVRHPAASHGRGGRAIPPDPASPALDAAAIERFESFVADLRPVFHRADQFLRFRAYLRGLLEPAARKNIEGLAAVAAGAMTVEADLPQALQHFVSHSPWDANRLVAAVRARRADAGGVWVVHDGVIPKKGRHSVGVQRQFARDVGKKLNCQVAVVVGRVGAGGYRPLAARLYLPAHWLRANADAADRTIPDDHRRPASKPEIALSLLDELREERPPTAVVAEDGYASSAAFTEGAASRALPYRVDTAGWVESARTGFEALKNRLGLDHFEGRTWAGWHHHVALVFAAHYFLTESALPSNPPIDTALRG